MSPIANKGPDISGSTPLRCHGDIPVSRARSGNASVPVWRRLGRPRHPARASHRGPALGRLCLSPLALRPHRAVALLALDPRDRAELFEALADALDDPLPVTDECRIERDADGERVGVR